ncbi:luciferin sulfotransferase-like [Coccinella septempunctata]|uniref:luciferin sulfotransferase-like n=1 Tax=Coccinella septempunctata TaxID=41139 RepID=UPI001D078DDB|nr:luciferin sulfotransferase-like [Coccinella septempunctata]
MEIVDIEENLNAQLKKDYEAQKDGFVQVGERKWFYPWRYRKTAEELKNFDVRPDDIWITGFPRSGTTLTGEIAWLLSHDLDFVKAREIELSSRVKFFELDIVINEKVEHETIEQFPEEAANFAKRRNILNSLREAKTRRVIKTHLPFELLPDDIFKKGCKVIYVCRYPKDVCVSYYFLQSNNSMMKFRGGFEKYWRYFKDGYCE